MIVVSDSTPLITLMKAAQLNILHDLFGEIVIPEAVHRELTVNPAYADEAEQINSSEFIRVISVEDRKTVFVLQRTAGLDLGESEAIVYADENNADLLLVDETSGRRVAKFMGLEIMGSIGVLVLAFKKGYLNLENAEVIFQKIRNSNRHISEKLIKDALDIIRR
ncbi:MAG: DUF3368 domain-containing protein [Synergistaceae bacterium]|nr:DUF3368 domain-containing protein [Synergistaceae bacterium]